MRVPRYDIQAVKNVMARLRVLSPGDYNRMMTRLARLAEQGQRGQLGNLAITSSQPSSNFWSALENVGRQAVAAIADAKLMEADAKQKQKQYELETRAELQRQALLAEQARTQMMDYQAQMQLSQQTRSLLDAADSSKATFQRAMLAVGALIGVWVIYRAVR